MLDKEKFLEALKSDKAVFEKMLMESAIAGKIQLIDQCILSLESGSFDFKEKEEKLKEFVEDLNNSIQDKHSKDLGEAIKEINKKT